jgi:hypothetical protein
MLRLMSPNINTNIILLNNSFKYVNNEKNFHHELISINNFIR